MDYPNLSQFYRAKSNFLYNDGFYQDDIDEVDYDVEDEDNYSMLKIAFYHLEMYLQKKEFIVELFQFIFKDLPLHLGIPKEYIVKDSPIELDYELIFSDSGDQTKRQSMIELGWEYSKRPFTELPFIYDFVSYLFNKYKV